MPLERKKVGEVFHFYGKIGVAAIRLTDDGIAIGDTVQIQGPSTNLEQTVDTLQIEHADVSRAGPGQEVGMKVRDRVREKDFVYKLLPTEGPVQAPPAKAPPKKARAKKAPRKKAPVRRKASRAPRSKARRGSRRSRPRSR
jgi:putative protease